MIRLDYKYLKAFSKEKSEALSEAGYEFLYESAGVYYHRQNKDLVAKFSASPLLADTKPSLTINF
jgi:hypothetical protein